jgi:predicted transcriptional regulator
MIREIDQLLIASLKRHTLQSSKEIFDGLQNDNSYATVKRALSRLTTDNLIATEGHGKSTKYRLSSSYLLLSNIDTNTYFQQEQDEREIFETFNFSLIPNVLHNASPFKQIFKTQFEFAVNTYF